MEKGEPMSLILKGINLPKEGEWLEVIIKPTKEVIVDTIRYRDNALLNTEYGSATQIPKSHGRLIDEQKVLLTNLEIFMCDGSYKEALKLICEKLDDAPTIIDAEE